MDEVLAVLAPSQSQKRKGKTMMPFWSLVGCLVVMSLCGCTASRRATLEAELTRPSGKIETKRGQSIVGYTDVRGVYHELDGHVRAISGDSLEFIATNQEGGLLESQNVRRFTVHRDNVNTLFVKTLSPGKTALAVVGVPAFVLGAVAAFTAFVDWFGTPR